ncbi:MAG: HEAT repeat domain-containing protein, partial [Gemmatimonadota bacterium]|nr:HEAT repeat domain-containing protein [Gemmatimonadota bacterium]
MPESDAKRELGGLARSIDALFSQPLPSVEPLPVADEMEPDPFDSLESYEELPAEQDPTPALTFAEGEASEEVAWDGPDLALEESVPSVDLATAAQPAAAQSPVDVGHEADGAGLQGAIESFLSGAPGAADDARAMSAKLQERLALDPLADAVERLVNLGGAAPDPDAVALAQEVINPAVASRLVQRMGHEEDHEKRAAYVILSERLGMVMAKAFRGALTDSNDARARRTYYDGLLAMGETSRPVIEAMVEDDNRFLVRNALALLGEMGGDRAVELVTSALANTDARVRCEALASLAKLGGEDTRQLVMASLEDSDSKVRAAAAVTAGELGIERALEPILEL